MISSFGNNTYSFYDNYLMGDPKVGEFYSISSQSSSQTTYIDRLIGQITILLDNESVHYERRVYNLYDMIGDIGGIYQVVIALFFFFINLYTSKLYDFMLVNGMFKDHAESKVTPLKLENSNDVQTNQNRKNKDTKIAKKANTLDKFSYHSAKHQNNQTIDTKANYNSHKSTRILKLDSRQKEN